MNSKQKLFMRNYKQMKRDLQKGCAEPFLFLIQCLDQGNISFVEEFLSYVESKNYRVYKELYNGISYRLEKVCKNDR